MPTIFSLAALHDDIDAALLDTAGEVTPAIQALLDVHERLETDKLDAYGIVYRDHMEKAAACTRLAEELTARAAQHRKIAEGRQRLMQWYMTRRDMPELQGNFVRFTRVTNGGVQKVDLIIPVEQVPDTYRKPLPPSPPRGEVDLNALRIALQAGREDAIAVAVLQPRTQRVDISFGPRKRTTEQSETVNAGVLDGTVSTADTSVGPSALVNSPTINFAANG
jgi:hypothetical protein